MDQLKKHVKAFKNRNYESFDAFYHATKRRVYLTIIQIVKDEQIAEDIMQDTYMQFLKKIDTIHSSQNPVAYLVKIGRNYALNYYNKYKREVKSDALIEAIPSQTFSDSTIDIFKLLDVLNHDEREVVVLHTINGFKFREVASVMDKPIGTVLWLHKKAMDKLKKKLGDDDEK